LGDRGGAAEREADLVANRIGAGEAPPPIRAVPDGGIHLVVNPNLLPGTRVKLGARTGTIQSEDASKAGYYVDWGNDNDNNNASTSFVSYEKLDRLPPNLTGWRTTLKLTLGKKDAPLRSEQPAEKDLEADRDLAAYEPQFGEEPAPPISGLQPMYPVVARGEYETNSYQRQVIERDKSDGTYVHEGVLGPRAVEMGTYQFAIRWSQPHEVLFGHTGHINVGNTGPVVYAGTLYFTADGVLGHWNNNTGHYKCSALLAKQATTVKSEFNDEPVLPIEKFQPYRR
jgi:hypothetical protein